MSGRLSLTELVEELQQRVEFQEVPREFDEDDYMSMVKYGVKHLFIDTGRESMYSEDLFISERGMEYFDMELTITEIEYILVLAQIRFFGIVRTSVNAMVSYTTDALSVTQGDKPYANISGSIRELEDERHRLFYKMVDYVNYEGS